jgi:GTPase
MTLKTERLKAFLITLYYPGIPIAEVRPHLRELAGLCETGGLSVCGEKIIKIRNPHPKFLVGSGKAAEIVDLAAEADADVIVFDDEISPAQQRNWEKLSKRSVIDRQELILEIFSDHAHTRESALQVELARLQYSLPRLKRAWTHLSRQRGGMRGTRGEGETQLEIDRRQVLQRIAKIKRDLDKVVSNRTVQRKQRRSVPVPTGSFVGYTNAGKSSLLNTLTGSSVSVQNKLFATLDPTTRRIVLPSGTDVLLTDTVGFIRKLPHHLVDAFKSTLEETIYADFLIHVLDCTAAEIDEQVQTTTEVLQELQITGKPIITVFNKIDAIKDRGELQLLSVQYPNAFFVSARTGEGMEMLKNAITQAASQNTASTCFSFPYNRYDLITYLYRTSRVLGKKYIDHHIELTAEVSEKTKQILKPYIVKA